MKSISARKRTNEVTVPYPFKSAKEMLEYCNSTGLSLSGMVMQNELALHSKKEIEEYFGSRLADHAGLY
ncbi:L-serine ammonia-lyase [Salmonella enterica subsp. enterica]|uniref:L-serine ammonia-lyase n=1 Tax=Salmonella enterica I TaxID=59201 RepID=A0A3S4JEC5_SALET|nr:L-serine ammonia-lyase [Salmonella enterica subsp. enterica]